MRRIALAAAVALASLVAAAAAMPLSIGNETIAYTYDAQGRLTNVVHSGSVNNNVIANYTYDHADNRGTVNVTGAP